jgi:hypothetical protein
MSSVTVIAGTSATGSYVSGTGDSGTFSYTYNSLYTRPKALASLGGSYSSTAISSGVAESFTLDNAGNISGTTLTGAFTGTLVLLDPAKNLYRVTMHYSTGTYSGLGFWSDTASGTLAANSLYILVANGTLYGLSAAFVKN